mgnify:CR=1 FL=1
MALIESAELTAVASRNIHKATKFGENHAAKKAYGSYEELFKDEEVSELIRFGMVAYYDNNDDAPRKGAALTQELTSDHQRFLTASSSLQGTAIGGDYGEDALSLVVEFLAFLNYCAFESISG